MHTNRLTSQSDVIRFCLLDADHNEGEIRLFGVDDSGKSVIVLDMGFKPYFYATLNKKAEALLKKNKMVTGIEKVKKRIGLKEVCLLKIFVDLPQNVPLIREAVKKHSDCYEYSINFYRRYLIDKGFYPLDWLEVEGNAVSEDGFDVCIEATNIHKTLGKTPHFKTLAFDLEVVDNKIVMASFAGHNFTRVVTWKKAKDAFVVKDEKELIEEFVSTVKDYDPDIIVGYNSDMFDFEVLRSRADEHKIKLSLGRDGSAMKFARRTHTSSARISGRLHIDLFAYVDSLMSQQLQSEVLTLNEVAKEIIGEGKEELSFEDIVDLWSNDVSRLAEYCRHDSELTLKLSKNILTQVFELSKVCGQLPFDTSRSTFGLLSEWFLVRKAHEKNIIIPNNPHWDEIQQRRAYTYKGGYVLQPVEGLHENIAVFDFRSLYPSIIVTFNISPETLNCNCCKNTGHLVPELKYHFCKKMVGFIPNVLKSVIDERVKIKERIKKLAKDSEEFKQLSERQAALKVLANAFYGYTAYPGSRWYSRECSEAAAAFGRYYIKKTIKDAEKFGEVIYSDTDSIFIKFS